MCRRRGVSFATAAVPSSASPTDDAEPTIPIPGTPCFTPRVSRSPMPEEDRQTYIVAASAAFRTYLESSAASSRGHVELRVPQLDPSSDVYCRRFLLSLTWALVRVAAVQAGLRTRILVQKPGDFYGGLPLSVAGLARFLAADWRVSKDGWPEDMVRLGAMGRDERIADDDEVIVIVSPTNAISMPVVEDLQRLSVEAGDRPIVLINPRLGDVPSHSGVMQVSGRKERMQLLDSFQDIFTCRLLYQSAKVRASSSFAARSLHVLV